MAASLVTSVEGYGLSNPTTGSVDTSGATLLVAVCSWAGTITGVSDNKSNTWTSLTKYSQSAVPTDVQIFYVNSDTPTVGTGHTFTLNGTSIAGVIEVMAFDGTAASPFDVENGNNGTAVSSLATGSVTPTNDGSVLIAGVTTSNAWSSLSIDTGFTISDSQIFTGGSNYGGGGAYLIQGTKTATNPTWSFGASTNGIAVSIAVFKPEAVGGATFTPKVIMY